jgi:hypothetical protein
MQRKSSFFFNLLNQIILQPNRFKKEHKHGTDNLNSYTQFLSLLKSKDHRVQLKAAKDFYAFLLNELKQVKKDDDSSFVDNLIPTIRELANENNQNISDKQACIYIITSIINLDNINVKVRKRHQISVIRWLKNLLAYSDHTVIHMASRAMGKYVQAGVDCHVEFKSGLDALRSETKRYQSILLIRELTLAYPPRLFLYSDLFFQNIMYSICDRNPQIRYESIELFRLALIISINRESTSNQQGPNSSVLNGTSSSHRIHRTSTVSSMESVNSTHDSNLNQNQAANSVVSNNDENLEKFKLCFKNSVKELESLLQEYTTSSRQSMSNQSNQQLSSSREDKIHGYLLIILEIIRFSSLDFEKQIEKYLSTYNLYHQQIQKANNSINSNSSATQGPNTVRI